MTDGYDVRGALPGDAVDALPRGTNAVIVGPAMTGKRDLALQLLAAGFDDDEGVLTITTDGTVDVQDFERHVPGIDPDRIGILDCSGKDGGSHRNGVRRSVSSPGDLTGISISVAKQLKALETADVSGIRYGLVSISTLLQFLDVQTVFKFLHVFTARVEDTGGLGVYTLSEDAHDPQAVNTILGQFDTVLRIRETDAGDRELQVRGGGSAPTPWMPFPYPSNTTP